MNNLYDAVKSLTSTGRQLNEELYHYLTGLGYNGSLTDMFEKYLIAQGYSGHLSENTHDWIGAVSNPSMTSDFANGIFSLSAIGGPSQPVSFSSLYSITNDTNLTYFNAAGTIQAAAANTSVIDHDPVTLAPMGQPVWESRMNVLLNSAALATQSVTVTAQAYTLSFYGTGTITLSGAYAGSLVGSGVFPARSTLTFTPIAGTLTLTVTGTVQYANCEAGTFATPHIPTTTAAVTRAAVDCNRTLAGEYNPARGSLIVKLIPHATGGIIHALELSDGTDTGRVIDLYNDGTNTWNIYNGTSSTKFATPAIADGVEAHLALAYQSGNYGFSIGGSAVTVQQDALVNTATTLRVGRDNGTGRFNGHIKYLRYYPRRLPDADLQALSA